MPCRLRALLALLLSMAAACGRNGASTQQPQCDADNGGITLPAEFCFVPRSSSGFGPGFESFADGFAGGRLNPGRVIHRSVGLAEAPDGAIYISDDQRGRVWRVVVR